MIDSETGDPVEKTGTMNKEVMKNDSDEECGGFSIRQLSNEQLLKIIQISEWSLNDRIRVCKVLKWLNDHVEAELKIMLDSVEEEYAKQCNLLLSRESTIPSQSDQSSSSTLEWFGKQPNFWTEMGDRLKSVRKRLRDNDQEKQWYSRSFAETKFEPQDIYNAVEKGDLVLFKEFMDQIYVEHWAFSPGEYSGATPLHWAALHGQNKIVAFMRMRIHEQQCAIAKGWREWRLRSSIVNARDEYGFTPLHLVAFPPLWKSAKRIHFKIPEVVDSEWAQVGKNCTQVIEDLSLMGALNISNGKNFREYARIWTYRADHTLSIARSTVEMGLCVDNFLRQSSVHPIHLAVWFSQPPIVKKLLEKWPEGAYSQTSCGNSTLHLGAWGVWKDNEEVMRILLEHLHREPDVENLHDAFSCKPDFVNAVNHDRQTPLHIAAFNGNDKVVDALLGSQQIKVNERNRKGYTPSEMAIIMCKAWGRANWSQITINTYFEKFGISNCAGKCLEERCSGLKSNVYNVIDLFDGGALKTVQLSEWSLEHRRMVLEMIDEMDRPNNIKQEYRESCQRVLSGSAGVLTSEFAVTIKQKIKSLRQNYPKKEWFSALREAAQLGCREEDVKAAWARWREEFGTGASGRWRALREYAWLQIIPRLHKTLMDINNAAEKVTKLIENIYDAVETGRLDDFKSLMTSIPVKHWSFNPGEYMGATPLHWAVLHGQNEMISFMQDQIGSDADMTSSKLRSSIVDAQDEYGFTPLHLVAFPSLWKLSNTKFINVDPRAAFTEWEAESEAEEEAKLAEETTEWTQTGERCAQLILTLSHMGATISGNSKDRKSVRIWTPLPEGILENKYLESTVHPIHFAVWFSHPCSLEILLERWPITTLKTTRSGDTILHNARVWGVLLKHRKDWGEIMIVLSKHLDSTSQGAVNFRNNRGLTPLHSAVLSESPEWVEGLFGFQNVEVDLRDRKGRTPRELAAVMLQKSTHTRLKYHYPTNTRNGDYHMDKIIYLIDCYNPAGLYRETDALQRDRQVYVDAANAILVGAALIASASFGAWLQPPLSYKPYYEDDFSVRDIGTPPGTYESFVAIKQYWIIHMFWIFNSLSFFFSLATVIAGADAALPQQGLKVKDAVESVRNAVKRASWLLSVAIVFVVGTFITVGFAILPHIEKYKINMYFTVFIGILVCANALKRLLWKLFLHDNPPSDVDDEELVEQLRCKSMSLASRHYGFQRY